MRGTTTIDVGVFSRRRIRELLRNMPFGCKIEVREFKGLFKSRFYVTFDGVDAYEAYRLLRREEG